MKRILLLFMLILPLHLAANEIIVAKKSGYIFTQKNIDEIFILGEFIGGSSFSRTDKKNLKIWLIDDFESDPKASNSFYKSLSLDVIPRIKKSKGNDAYRAELYLNFIDLFNKNPQYTKSPHNFLATINHYNPPLKGSRELQLLYRNMLISNQQNFNRVMSQLNRTTEMMRRDFKDSMTRQNIILSGDTILYELDDRIIVKDKRGLRYEVFK